MSDTDPDAHRLHVDLMRRKIVGIRAEAIE